MLYALILTVCQLIESHGGQVTLAGDTGARVEEMKRQLTKGKIRGTLRDMPRAYVLRVSIRSAKRLIYLFDPAGESFPSDLTYLDKVTAFIFVIDPLLARNVLQKFTPARRRELEVEFGSERPPPADSFTQTRERLTALGMKQVPASLALVVSKSDLLAEARVGGLAWDNTEKLVVGSEGMALRQVIGSGRDLRKEFRKVGFFETAAISGSDHSEDGVRGLALWLLRSGGIALRG